MDTLIQEMIDDDPNIKRFWRDKPIYHFDHTYHVDDNPDYFPIIDWELGTLTGQDRLNLQKYDLYRHISTYRYSRISPKKTQRGVTRKHQITFDLHDKGDLNQTDPSCYPWNEFYDIGQVHDFWVTYVRKAAFNVWLPILDAEAIGLAKRVKVTAVRDNIMTNEEYSHPFELSDDRSLLSVVTYVNSTSPVKYELKNKESGDTVSYLMNRAGYGIVTAPKLMPYEHRISTIGTNEPDDNEIVNGTIDYLVFDIIE